MPEFESDVTLPEAVTSFFKTFAESGGTIHHLDIDGGTFAFRYQADDLWDAAEFVALIRPEAPGTKIGKGRIVSEHEPVQGIEQVFTLPEPEPEPEPVAEAATEPVAQPKPKPERLKLRTVDLDKLAEEVFGEQDDTEDDHQSEVKPITGHMPKGRRALPKVGNLATLYRGEERMDWIIRELEGWKPGMRPMTGPVRAVHAVPVIDGKPGEETVRFIADKKAPGRYKGAYGYLFPTNRKADQ